ncbi:MAG: pseudouridine-5'-phosphate glycosidase [Microbacteriaceae bacterium]|nr:pseudouridine-5'-phosphate glycosidase [Microbacteriaceae bacterium]
MNPSSGRAARTDLVVDPEVAAALAGGRAVVALESTILTHGMPYPQNLQMARRVEAIIREEGAIPATIAVLDGEIRVGLPDEDLERLSQVAGARKLSRADIAFALAQGLTGGTTVAATMLLARLAGIDVFATGGIGGVHAGAETTFDESADLPELGRTDVVVVSAGPKAILDIPKTLERLETLGVPVVVYDSDELPAFWSRASGIPAPLRLDSPAAIARLELARRRLHGDDLGGLLVANPVPAEAEIPAAEMAGFIAAAQADAEALGISGKAVTPYLLQRELELTDGRSLVTNIALVEHNARLAARIAAALVALP